MFRNEIKSDIFLYTNVMLYRRICAIDGRHCAVGRPQIVQPSTNGDVLIVDTDW